jgi:hypothetical protein
MALGLTQPLNRNKYQESSWSKGQPACKGDNLTAICEPHGPPWPVTGIALPFSFYHFTHCLSKTAMFYEYEIVLNVYYEYM